MERARKWLMVPAESENSQSNEDNQPKITENDLLVVIKLAKQGRLSDNGTLLDSNKKPLVGSNIYQCLTQKSNSKQYNKFLEAKANLSVKEKKVKQSNKRKKTTVLEWSDDE